MIKISNFCAQMVDFCRPGHIFVVKDLHEGSGFTVEFRLKQICTAAKKLCY